MTPALSDIFFTRTGMDEARVGRLVSESLHDMDDGELFLEYAQSENLVFDDGRLKNASFNTSQGFGLRSVLGEASAYAHASDVSEEAVKRAAATVRAVHYGQPPVRAEHIPPFGTNARLYADINPLKEVAFERKVELLQKIDAYVRARDPRVKQVSASLSGQWQAVRIIKADGRTAEDIRPLVRLNVSVIAEQNGRMETGSSGAGGRVSYAAYIAEGSWKKLAGEALRQALVNLESIPAPAGEMPVVLGPGWCGVLLHEAVGHGLEGDFNRKGTSAFSGLMGKQVAARGVTVVDDGTLPNRRGSLSIDDEGTPSGRNVLIEDGILTGYIQDRLNARLMNMEATGNGRRESFAHQPMPRMTNTCMLGGSGAPGDIIASVKRGIYAAHLGGGQVDITSGKFVFSASEAYLIENGRIAAPLKGATLIGNGPDILTKVRAVGNDMALDDGVGTCGKAGQSVPVGVGQPTLLIDGLTVGGTAI
ncbi:MAG: metalloprotease TldD [Pseudomonadota bacterium]|nr:metalloprotease TldD [Pseudomonadota bacterium]MDE3037254.1 metalloprotease TldD [Pseudomonadota bacterium]